MNRTLKVFDMKFVLLVTLQTVILVSVWCVLYELSELTAAPHSGGSSQPAPPRQDADSGRGVVARAALHRDMRRDLPPLRTPRLPADSVRGGEARLPPLPDPGLGQGRAAVPRAHSNHGQSRPTLDSKRVAAVYRDTETWHLCPHICDTTAVFLHVLLRTPTGDMTIFVHDTSTDMGVSDTIMRQGAWQPDIAVVLIRLLLNDSTLDFLDIGAHVGPFSLAAAKIGRRVFAVEPFTPSAQRLCRSAYENKVQSRISIVHNALWDWRRQVGLRVGRHDKTRVAVQGNATGAGGDRPLYAVLLDDLLEVFDVSRVVIKLDASGQEARVLRGGSLFFQQVSVPYILLTWANVRGSGEAGAVLQWMQAHHFLPLHPLQPHAPLDSAQRDGWPDRVLWRKVAPAPEAGQGFWNKFGF